MRFEFLLFMVLLIHTTFWAVQLPVASFRFAHPFKSTSTSIDASIRNDKSVLIFFFRKSISLQEYQDQLNNSLRKVLGRFQREQRATLDDAQKKFETYMLQFQRTYNETQDILRAQKLAMNELNLKIIGRPRSIDESLDKFRKWYDESIESISSNVTSSTIRVAEELNFLNIFEWVFPSKSSGGRLPLADTKLEWAWKSALENSQRAERLLRATLSEFMVSQDERVNQTLAEMRKSQRSMRTAWYRGQLRSDIKDIEVSLRLLERDGTAWVEDKLQHMETALKAVQDKLYATNRLYEEMLSKSRSTVEVVALNDQILRRVLALVDPSDKGWKFINEEDGITVYRKFLPGAASQYACVKCSGIVNASARDVFNLLDDSSRVKEYNTFFNYGRDVEIISPDTRIVWCCSPPVFPMKPRDFCTIVHVRQLRDGTFVVLNRGTTHVQAPETKEFVRASIVLAANIIQPIPGSPKKCHLTMITQLNPGGFAPPVVVNHICSLGPIGFMKSVEKASNIKKNKWMR